MSPSIIISILLPSIILLSILLAPEASIDDICKAVNATPNQIDYNECASILRADPRSEKADARELGLIGTQLCLADATNYTAKLNDMIRYGNYSRVTKVCIRECVEKVYKLQIKQLTAAIRSYKLGNLKDALDKVSTVDGTAADCGYIFFDCHVPDVRVHDNLRKVAMLTEFLIERLLVQ